MRDEGNLLRLQNQLSFIAGDRALPGPRARECGCDANRLMSGPIDAGPHGAVLPSSDVFERSVDETDGETETFGAAEIEDDVQAAGTSAEWTEGSSVSSSGGEPLAEIGSSFPGS
jgi:hypothetical protein